MIDFEGRSVMVTGAAGGVGQCPGYGSVRVRRPDCRLRPGRNGPERQAHRRGPSFRSDRRRRGRNLPAGSPRGTRRRRHFERRLDTRRNACRRTTAALDNEMNLNFRSAAVLSQALLPAMRDQPQGAAFVFISSVNALAHFGNPAYAAAKAALSPGCAPSRRRRAATAFGPMRFAGLDRTGAWDHRIAERSGNPCQCRRALSARPPRRARRSRPRRGVPGLAGGQRNNRRYAQCGCGPDGRQSALPGPDRWLSCQRQSGSYGPRRPEGLTERSRRPKHI